MFLSDLKELKTGPRELRNFGLLVGGVFAAIGLLLLVKENPMFPWLLIPGLFLMVLGAAAPKSLKYPYLAWMFLALVLGFIISHLILTLFFFLVVSPIGLAARLVGKDFLRLKLDRNATTYWLPREKRDTQPAEYEQQF